MTVCPRKRSATTPCVVTDGEVCYAFGIGNQPVCVSCGATPRMTGVLVDAAEWDAKVEEHLKGQRKI